VVERGFDENLQQGARCIKQPTKPLISRVFAENFAAKLLQPPQSDQASGFILSNQLQHYKSLELNLPAPTYKSH
jgi:hypothetical protein